MAPAVALDHTTPGPVPESNQTPTAFQKTDDLFSLGGRTTVVTGGGRGLGITFASAVIEAGGDVVCLDLLPEPSQPEWATVQKLAASKGLWVEYIKCDITNEEMTKAALDKVALEGLQRNMPLRGLVTSAGINQLIPAMDYPLSGFQKVLDIK